MSEMLNKTPVLEVRDLRKHYGDNQVLRGITETVYEGEKVAIIGPSGGGKTTLCNLIPRFYDTTKGAIRIDGKDIRRVTMKSLRG